MKRAAIYSRVDPTDRSTLPAHKATAEEFCQVHGWSFVHFTDSGSGSRPPMQFATHSQLIRPQLTRLLTEVQAGRVDIVVPSSPDALATKAEVLLPLLEFLEKQGLSRQDGNDAIPLIFTRAEPAG